MGFAFLHNSTDSAKGRNLLSDPSTEKLKNLPGIQSSFSREGTEENKTLGFFFVSFVTFCKKLSYFPVWKRQCRLTESAASNWLVRRSRNSTHSASGLRTPILSF